MTNNTKLACEDSDRVFKTAWFEVTDALSDIFLVTAYVTTKKPPQNNYSM